MTRIMGVTRARREFTAIVNRADEHREPVYLVNFNEPRAVLIGYQTWEGLMARLEDLEDLVSIYQGRTEPTRPLADVLNDIDREHAPTQHALTVAA